MGPDRCDSGVPDGPATPSEDFGMTKGMDKKRETKKKPEKTLKEKREAKRAKQQDKKPFDN